MSEREQRTVDVDRLMALDLFADLDHHDLALVAKWTRDVRAEPGEVLFEQGEVAFELLVIEDGEVEVVRDHEVLATVGAGEPVGEMSVLRGERRMASVRALTQVTAIALSAEDLGEMGAEMPEVVRSIRWITEQRAAQNADRED